ncbi:MAG: hypothetical protein WCF22_05375 [Candidatus Sulfotelmatobacter sp.]
MKSTLFLALIILTVIPASAQKAMSPKCSANTGAATAAAQDYAARVDGLLRDVHASLQKISEGLETGSVTPQQAQKLKLAATRDMISRLDAIAAVYDVRLQAANHVEQTGSALSDACDAVNATHTNANGTVSVEELKCEAAVAPRGEQVTR